MKILAVIPARGGSKGIPRKNVRLMNGKPLICYAINNALGCKLITDTVVSTDDEEIADISAEYGAVVIKRDKRLADDATTLDPVVFDAVSRIEQLKNTRYDIVITLQPTSPLLSVNTLSSAIDCYIKDGADTFISVVNKPHLSWTRKDGAYFPLYEKRLNRQELPPNYLETGAFVISKREFVTEESRIGPKAGVYRVPEAESIDIDTVNDWVVCESVLKKKKIVFRADGHKALGMGHIYHCLTLAYHLTAHDVLFVLNQKYPDGINKVKESFFPYKTIKNDAELFEFLKESKPDIIVNDCLDTERAYIETLKAIVPRVVTIEDLGSGIHAADAVINALYDGKDVRAANIYSGEKYVCLRDEFVLAKPKPFSPEIKEVVVVFGGSDPHNFTRKVYDMANLMSGQDIMFTFVTGPAYDAKANGIVNNGKNIIVLDNVKRISTVMKKADLAFTSQGRTVFELASLGIPAIVLAQNKREQLHAFAQMSNGFLNLGLGESIEISTLRETFEWLKRTPQIRREMRELMLKHKLGDGINNIEKIILGE